MHKMRFQISKQINHWSGGFVTVGLASHWLCVTDNSGITIYGLMALEREMSSPPILSRSVAQFALPYTPSPQGHMQNKCLSGHRRHQGVGVGEGVSPSQPISYPHVADLPGTPAANAVSGLCDCHRPLQVRGKCNSDMLK